MSLKDEVAIVGVALVRGEGANADLSAQDLAMLATHEALADAGLDRTDLQGFAYSTGGNDPGAMANQMGVPEVSFAANLTSGPGGGPGGLALVAAAIHGGFSEVCLTLVQVQQAPRSGGAGPSALVRARPGAAASAYGTTSGGGPDASFSAPAAIGSYGAAFAITANRYLYHHGISREELGEVVVIQRANAGQKLTLEEYLAAPMVIDPLTELDAAPGITTSYAAAVITTSAERAKDLRQPPILIVGAATGGSPINGAPFQGPEELLTSAGHLVVADRLFAMAGLSADDIDVALLYDDFSPMVLMQLENYGFCPRGEAGEFVADGHTRLGGSIPVNTHGGNISDAYVRGETHVIEAVQQLRGTATNQVDGAATALVTGDPGSLPLSAAILRKA
jgi:acetyl-CoA acetyltransferase